MCTAKQHTAHFKGLASVRFFHIVVGRAPLDPKKLIVVCGDARREPSAAEAPRPEGRQGGKRRGAAEKASLI